MSDGHATADLELSTSDTAVPSRADKTHVPEPSAATLMQDGSTKGSEPATGQTFVVESPPVHRNGRDAAPAESQTLIAPPDGGANETDGDYRFGATVVADGAAGQDHDFGATLVGENIGVGNGDEFHMGATIAGGDDPAARATRVADVVNSLDPAGPAGEFELQPGESLIGRFRVLKVLGEGSFGAVYLAEDPQLDRRVAIKVTKVGVLTTRSDVDRFQREAKAAAQLRHPNIVPVYEVGRIGRSSFLAYEFIDGHTLGSRLKEAKKLPAREAAQMMHAISGALGYAHELGIIHRDMKPDNVLVDKHGQPHIADFGLARRDSGEMDKTREGGLMGTPLYMSPEQASGRSHEADARADVWSLGVMLREMLTGVLPFQGKLTEILIGIQTIEPPSIRTLDPSLPKDLETICQKCLSKDPALRYANGTELAAELDRYLRGEPILARPLSMPARLVRWAKRNPKEAFAAGLIVALLLGISIVSTSSVYALNREQEQRALKDLNMLEIASTGSVPTVIDNLKQNADFIAPHLQAHLDATNLPSMQRNRLKLAQASLPGETASSKIDFEEIADTLVTLSPEEMAMQVSLLTPHTSAIVKPLLGSAHQQQNLQTKRMALYALAKLAPGELTNTDIADVAAGLLPLNAGDLIPLLDLIEPVRTRIGSELERSFEQPASGVPAARVLAELYRNEPEMLFALSRGATPPQLQQLVSSLSAHPQQTAKLVRSELSRAAVGASLSPEEVRSRTNAFLVLSAVAPESTDWEVLAGGADNTLRTEIIHALPQATDWRPVWERLHSESNPLVRQALLLILAKVPLANVPAEDRAELRTLVANLFESDRSPAVHAAARQFLESAGGAAEILRIAAKPAGADDRQERDWFRNSQSQEFAVIKGPVEFLMGAPPDDIDQDKEGGEKQHRRLIPRSFAIGMHEVTVEQYLKFNPDHLYNTAISPEAACPITDLSWIDAAKYCRWLSEQEGMPEDEMVYPPADQITAQLQLAPDVLNRTGYRLPTAGEWEFACRAGSVTSRWIGSGGEEKVKLCAWYHDNSNGKTRPVGGREPNGLGLFDTLGNVAELCHNLYQDEPPDVEEGRPVVDGFDARDGVDRESRGTCYDFPMRDIRASLREGLPPGDQFTQVGFRLARTIRE